MESKEVDILIKQVIRLEEENHLLRTMEKVVWISCPHCKKESLGVNPDIKARKDINEHPRGIVL